MEDRAGVHTHFEEWFKRCHPTTVHVFRLLAVPGQPTRLDTLVQTGFRLKMSGVGSGQATGFFLFYGQVHTRVNIHGSGWVFIFRPVEHASTN